MGSQRNIASNEEEGMSYLRVSNKSIAAIVFALLGLSSPGIANYYSNNTSANYLSRDEGKAITEELRELRESIRQNSSSIVAIRSDDSVFIERVQRIEARSTLSKSEHDIKIDSLREKLSIAASERAVNKSLIDKCNLKK